jgi:hypothetical protein
MQTLEDAKQRIICKGRLRDKASFLAKIERFNCRRLTSGLNHSILGTAWNGGSRIEGFHPPHIAADGSLLYEPMEAL